MNPSTVSRAALPQSVIREASEWFVRMAAEEASAADNAAWQRWLQASPLHRSAWERVEILGRQFGQVEPQTGLMVLDRPRSRGRRQALKTLTLAVGIGAGGLAATRLPWQVWASDFSTGIGERRTVTLADGTVLTLNTDSAADVRFDSSQRSILLRLGELHVATHKDAQTPARPFVVDTPMGRVTALGTRFVLRMHSRQIWVAVTEGAVRIEPSAGGGQAARIVEAGDGTHFNAYAVQPVRQAPHADAWVQGSIFADNMRLGDFVTELGRYRQGRISCDPRVADLRISGSYPLGDTDRILLALEWALPVRADRFTRYWVTLRARS